MALGKIRLPFCIDVPEHNRVPLAGSDFQSVRGEGRPATLEIGIEIDKNSDNALISGVRQNVGM